MKTLMRSQFAGIAVILALVAIAGFAQQPYSDRPPSREDPLRFTAFAVQMQAGMAGQIDIVIERFSTEQERQTLIALVPESKGADRREQTKLLEGLESIEPRAGYIRTQRSLGWDIKYAHADLLPDGSRRIVVATDKPVSILAAARGARTMDYPFSLVEMRFPAGSHTGEGKLAAQTSISAKDGKLQLEIYGQEPTRLTTITEHARKRST